MSVIITRMRFAKSRLAQIPERERGLFFMLGHISNELAILSRFASLCRNYTWPEEVRGPAQIAQAMLVLRLLGGKCKEAWEFIRKAFIKSPLGREYNDKIGDVGTGALSELRRIFDGPTILHDLRNEFAFHYFEEFAERLAASFDRYGDSYVDYYAAERRVNSLHHTADVLLNVAMFSRRDESDLTKSTDRMMAEVTNATGPIRDFCEALMWAIALRHLGENCVETEEEFSLEDAPDVDQIGIPAIVIVNRPTPSKR